MTKKNRYFTPERAQEKEAPKLKPLAENLIFPEGGDFKESVLQMKEEFVKLQAGTSKYRAQAIHLGLRGTCPAIVALDDFENKPGAVNLRRLMVSVSQDFGDNTWAAFREWIERDFPSLERTRI